MPHTAESAPTAVATDVSDQAATNSADRTPVRLSVNLAPDVAAVLKLWTTSKHLSITEGIRRAIAVWNFLETERGKGNTLAVIEKDDNGDPKIREIVLV